MSYLGTPTLDQLRVFLTVVDVGSFAGAARKLHRATSVVSYTIANMEAQLGVSLFDRESSRKPQLTEAVVLCCRTHIDVSHCPTVVERNDVNWERFLGLLDVARWAPSAVNY